MAVRIFIAIAFMSSFSMAGPGAAAQHTTQKTSQRAGRSFGDTIPTWLDTTAPVVQIQPQQIWHNSLFHVTFKTNKQATVWYCAVTPSSPTKKEMEIYREPFTVLEEGRTRVYFQGEDLFGNKSRIDSLIYVFDTRQPVISVRPDPGRYRSKIVLHIEADKPCRFFWLPSLIDTAGKPVPESLSVNDSLSGYIVAVDRAGNRAMTRRQSWVVDSTTIRVEIAPKEGIYNTTSKNLSFTAYPAATVFYSFDPSAPPHQFSKVDKAVRLPYGTTIVRYFAKSALGMESDIMRKTYVVDTVPPKLLFVQKSGTEFDTLVLSTKKPSAIHYTLDATYPTETSPVYGGPVVVPRKGKCGLKAMAKDVAGNRSELFEWNYKYDKTPPLITLSRQAGFFSAPFNVFVRTSKPASILYTLDGTPVNQHSALYKDNIAISKEGSTTLRIMAIDDAGNASDELLQEYVIDSKPPIVKARVEEDVRQNAFFITLTANEPASIHYEIDGPAPTLTSPEYAGRIAMRMGQVLRYFAVDKAGNRSEVRVMDDLKKPIVSVYPEGGVHNRPLKIAFHANEQTAVYWRIAPDTTFTMFRDSLVMAKEGTFTLEYYSEGQNGLSSPIRRAEYVMDFTPPQTDVIVRKGNNDSVSVFFECSKNATIYYTIDGSNPAYSATTRTVGNKFLVSRDRISVKRVGDVSLAFFAEDAAGNQSPIRVLDVFKPRAVPDVPSGRERVYDRVLSVSLNTYDSKSVVYYARHGHTPTTDSAVFSQPLTLVASDTIMAFVVDAAGYRGLVDTFVYLIDLPPSPEFTVTPLEVRQGASATFDASKTIDFETPAIRLLYRWSFSGDSASYTSWKNERVVSHSFGAPGRYAVALQVQDERKRIVTLRKDVLVRELCPVEMASLSRADGSTFCIDKYEWPNIVGENPLTSVSWVQAKIYCMDAGKRLCTAEEWSSACRGPLKSEYPYGVKYEKGKCPAEGSGVYRSGKFPQCGEKGGPQDMVGNVWEWVEDKRGDYPVMMGGSFRFGEAADCNCSSEGGVGLKSNEVGFRCCK
jgi:Sulfatase-modifying factor enzyme 1/Chitobiase/beta-hexosaminidase C-terminal domain/PKD domain